jgi:DNA modification methylase
VVDTWRSADGRHTVHTGDCLTQLRLLPDASVQTVVTSPPYYGLRDYGSGEWVGGDPACGHQPTSGRQGKTGARASRTFTGEKPQMDRCSRCGAERIDHQLGHEPTPQEYVDRLLVIFREVRRVLRDDGTIWVNLGDSYADDSKWGGRTSGKHNSELHGDTEIGRRRKSTGLKPKDLIGIPWRVAFALQADGWYLRNDCIWSKPNPMPSPVRDRCTLSHEYLFLLSKSRRYYFAPESIQEKAAYAGKSRGGSKQRYAQNNAGMDSKVYDTRNKRTVWTVSPQRLRTPDGKKHHAVFPPKLIIPCVLASSPPDGVVLDPFAGSGTVAIVAAQHLRQSISIELNPEYAVQTARRIEANMRTHTPSLLEASK